MSTAILTNAFATYKAQCEATNKPIVMDEFVFALIPNQHPDTPINPEETLPADSDIKGRFKVTQKGMINPDAVVYSIILGTEVGTWDFNWVGLVNSEQNIVGAISHTPIQTKTAENPNFNIAGDTLTRNIITPYMNASTLTQITITADVWQLDFNSRLTAIDERIRLDNINSYGQAAFIQNAWQATVHKNAMTLAPGTAYIAGLQCINKQSLLVDMADAVLPKKLYLEACFKGGTNSQWQTQTTIVIADAHPATRIEDGVTYYSSEIATVTTLSTVTDLRVVDWRTTHLNEDNDPHPQYTKKTDIEDYVPLASEDLAGRIQIATQQEVNTGADSKKAVTPATLKPAIDDAKNYALEQANRIKSDIYGGIPITTLDTIKEVADALTETGDAVASLFEKLGEKLPDTVFEAFKKTVTDSLNNKLGKTEKATDSSRLNGYGADAYLCDNGWNESPGQDANTQPGMSADFTYSNNAPLSGSLIRMGAGRYDIQINTGYGGTAGLMQTRSHNGDNNTWSPWLHIYTDAYKPIAVLSGVIWHGGTIPVPAGFSRSQCQYIVGLNDSGNGAWDVDENGTYPQYRTRCSVNQSTGVVTALRDVVNHGVGNVQTGCMANYMVIATR